MGIHNKYTRIKEMHMNVFETFFFLKLQTSSSIFQSLCGLMSLHFMVMMVQDVYGNEERKARLWIPGLSPFPQAPGPAGLARTCLGSHQCTLTEIIYYLFPSYLFVSVSWNLPAERRLMCDHEQREQFSFVFDKQRGQLTQPCPWWGGRVLGAKGLDQEMSHTFPLQDTLAPT